MSSPVTQVPPHSPGRKDRPRAAPRAPGAVPGAPELSGPLQCPEAGGSLCQEQPSASAAPLGRPGRPGQMAVAGWDVNCIVHQQLTAASVCPRRRCDVAVRAGGARGGSGEIPGQQDTPQVTQTAGGAPPHLTTPPDISLCPPGVPCSPRYPLLTPQLPGSSPRPVASPKAREATKSLLTTAQSHVTGWKPLTPPTLTLLGSSSVSC